MKAAELIAKMLLSVAIFQYILFNANAVTTHFAKIIWSISWDKGENALHAKLCPILKKVNLLLEMFSLIQVMYIRRSKVVN